MAPPQPPAELPDDDPFVWSRKIRVLPDGRVPAEDTAEYLGVAPATLTQWRYNRKGPPWVRVGGRIFYFLRDLEAFVADGKIN
jgi:hypothetical protein